MKTNSFSNAAFAVSALLAAPADAFWRMPCPGRLVLERADPIVSPGVVADHSHTVSGGSGFGFTTDFDQMRASECSSCPVKKDMSAYWTPNLYYMAQNGSYVYVPQAGEGEGKTGGMTVYYEQRPDPGQPNTSLKAFPPGLRILAGDPMQRNETNAMAAPGQAVSFVCLDYSGQSSQSLGMPTKKCPDGLRAQVYFPSCWDGKNLDSPDHRSHMAYPIGHYDNGACPSTHPVHLISIFFEVIYSTGDFEWYGDEQPFVFSMGDRTGYGFHGDFVNGWDVDTLQKAIDTCDNLSGKLEDCHVFDNNLFTDDECQACRIPPSVDEPLTGVLEKLAGCNTPTNGPERAVKAATCAAATIGQPETYYTDMTQSMDWKYAGCASDDVGSRTFTGASTSSDSMTVKSCIEFCKSKGYSLAGLEFASQCYCDNSYKPASRAPQAGYLGNCWQPCAGDSKEICGGGGSLSVYQACEAGKPCDNAQYTMSGNSTTPVSSNPSSSAMLPGPSSSSSPQGTQSVQSSQPAQSGAPTASGQAPYSTPGSKNQSSAQVSAASASSPAAYSTPAAYSSPAAHSTAAAHSHKGNHGHGHHSASAVLPTATNAPGTCGLGHTVTVTQKETVYATVMPTQPAHY